MKSKLAIVSSGAPRRVLCLLFLFCGLFGATQVMAQAPIRIINPSGGGAGDPGLRIEVYADGSYAIFRDGKRETYEGSDQMNWQSAASNIRGPQAYISIFDDYTPPATPYENNLQLLKPTYVSPVYGSGTSTAPWKIQLMGTASQVNYGAGNVTYNYVIILNYIQGNAYLQTDYMLYFSNGNLSNSDIGLYHTERLVMGADAADLTGYANSECAIGYISGEKTTDGTNVPVPSVVAGYRTGNCGGSVPFPRSHVLKLNGSGYTGTFHSFYVGDARNRMNLLPGYVDQVLTDNVQSAPAASTYTGVTVEKLFSVAYGDTKWEWASDDADSYHHLSISSRILTGFGAGYNDFGAINSGTAPTTYNSEPVKAGFLAPTVKITEGNATAQYTSPMIYLTGLNAYLATDLMLELDTVAVPVSQGDGAVGAPSTDYHYLNGVLLKKFSSHLLNPTDTLKIPLDSFFINGNTALEYNRAFKFKIKSNHGLISVDPGKDTCRVIIVDDEPRDLTLSPLNTTITEGDAPTIRASLPAGVTTTNPVTINLHLRSLANTSGFSLPATALIPAGQDHVDFTLTTVTDNILERDDTLHISADGQIMGQTGTSTTDAIFILKDKTRTDPNNLKITFSPATGTVDKGQTNQHITASLPTGITTAIPIDITVTNDATTNADPSSYAMPLHIFIDSAKNNGSLTYFTRLDSIVYGPLVKHVVLKGSAADTAGNTFTLTNMADIGINDKNWPLTGTIAFTRSAASIDEGAGNSALTLTLPDNLVAGRDFGFAISTSSSLSTGQHVLSGMPTDSVHITVGNKSKTFATISTATDAVVGNDETVTFTAASNTVPTASIGSTTVNIVDKTVVGPPVQITFTPVTSTVAEGQKTSVKIQLEGTKTLPLALTLDFSIINGTTSTGDASVFTTTYTLPANTNSATVNNITLANADAIIEGNETFQITATPTGPAVIITPADVTITDETRKNATQTALTINTVPATWTKGDTKTITVNLPVGTTTQVPITVNFTRDAASTVTTAGVILPATPIVIAAGSTSTTFQVQVPTDLEVYGPLTRHLTLDGSAADGALPTGAFTAAAIDFDVNDNNWPLAHPLVISGGSINEGGTAFTNTITLPDGLKAGRDLNFNVTNTNSITTGKHVIPQPGAMKIASGSKSANIASVSTPVDSYIGNDEDVTFSAAYTGTGNATDAQTTDGVVHITDATDASTLGITITPSLSSLDEGQTSDVTVALTGGLQLLQPVTITLTSSLSGTLTASDFTLNTTTLVLPIGTTSKTFTGVLTANTDKVLETNEPLKLKAVVTSGPAITIPDVAFTIKDKTHSIAGATTLTVTPSATSVQKGGNITLDLALPATYTTETPISTSFTWDNTSTTGSTGYTLSSPVTFSTGGGTSVTLTATTDNVVYGPDIHQLKLTSTASDVAGSFTINNVSVNVTDNNWPLVHPLLISGGSINEGGPAFTNTITLPDGLKAGRDLNFDVTNTNSLTTGQHVIPQPGAIKIANGSKSGNIAAVSTPVDAYIGNDEDVTFAATYTGAGSASDATVTSGAVHITDKTDASTLGITITPSLSSLDEGQTSDITVALTGGLQLLQPVTITLTSSLSGTLTASDFTLNTTTLVLPIGTTSKTFTGVLTANTDKVLETNEPLKLKAVVTSGPAITIPDVVFTIKDKTHSIAGATTLTVTPSATSVQKGGNITLDLSLPATYTTEISISTSFTWDHTSTTGSTGYTLSSPVTFSTGSHTSVTLTATTDNVVYGPDIHQLKLTSTASDVAGSFTINNVSVNVTDNNWPLVHPLVISGGSINEGGTAFTNTITLPDGLKAGRDLNFDVTNTNSLTTGQHVIPQPGAIKIANGSKSGNIAAVSTPVDAYIGNDEDVTFAATYTGAGSASDASVTSGAVHITDKTDASALGITITPSLATLDEGQSSDVTVSLNGGLQLLQPITITLTPVLNGTLTNSDFNLTPTTLILPAGTSSKVFNNVLHAQTDKVLEGNETLIVNAAVTTGPAITIPDVLFTIKDKTHSVAGATTLTVTPSAGSVQKGGSITLTLSLPATYSTEIPISTSFTWDNTSTTGSTGYTLGASPVVFSSGTGTTVTLIANTDNVVYGPATHQLKLNTGASDAAGVYNINNIAVDVTDNNWPLAHPLVISTGSITEGGTAFTNTITLPDGLKAGRDLDFNVSNTNGITLGAHTIPQPGAIKILSGASSANIENVTTSVDNFVGNDEDVTFSATYTGTGLPANATVSNGKVHITDATSGSLHLTLTPASSTLSENNAATDVTLSIAGGLILLQPLKVELTPVLSGTTTAADFTLHTTTLTLPAGATSKTFSNVLQANSDGVLENTESLKITGAITSGQTATVPDMNFTINDLTHNTPANLVVNIAPAASSLQKGATTALDILLPAGITTEIPITINLSYDGSSTVSSGSYTLGTTNPVTFSSGNGTSLSLMANTDNIVYGPDPRQLKLDVVAQDAVKPFTINDVVVAVTDNNWPLVHPLIISSGSITEGSTTFTNTITLPDGLQAGRDLDFNVTNTNGITTGKHIIPQPGTVTIAAGSKSANIANVSTPVDSYIGNDEDVTFSATYTGPGTPANATVTSGIVHITDATSTTLGLTLTPASTTLDENDTPTDVTLSINGGITLLQPLTIQLTPVNSGTVTAADYKLLQTTLTLPVGATSKTFSNVLQASSDQVLEGTEVLKISGTVTSGQTATVPDMNISINDLTHNTPANLALTVTPAAGTVAKGNGTTLKIALPTGITTEIPINVQFNYDGTSTVSGTGYTLGSNPVSFSSGNNTTVALQFPSDNILFWPLVYTLKLNTSASDAVKPFTVNNISVNETDNNYPLQHPLIISHGTINEGDAPTPVTITLPDGLQAGHDMSFNVTNTNSLTLGTHGVTSPTAPVLLTSGTTAATIENVSVPIDKYIGNDEDVTFSATGDFTVADGVLHIADKTGSTLTLSLFASNNLDEGMKSHVGVQLENNLILLQPLTIQFSVVDSTTKPGDYTLLQNTVTIPAGEDSHVFADVLQANTDQVLEASEYLTLRGTVTSGQSITVPDVRFKINDITHTIAANTAITLTPSAPSPWTKGDSRQLTVALPMGVTTEVPIVIHTTPAAGSQLQAGAYLLPSPITLSSGNDTVVSFNIFNDNYVYGPQTQHLQLTGDATDPVLTNYTVSDVNLDIIDKNYATLGSLILGLDAASITEGGAATNATLSLPGSLKAGRALAFSIKTVSSLTTGGHAINWPTDSVRFAYGDHSITFATPQAVTDKVMGNDEDITINAAAPGFTVTSTSLHISDATASDPLSGAIILSSSNSHVQEGQSVQLTATLAPGITTTQPVIITLAAGAASVATSADYNLPATLTIPAGSNSASITLNATTDNILEPTELLRITGSSTSYPGLTVQSVDVNIDDATRLDPANVVLQITIDSTTIHKGNTTTVHIGFANPNITVAAPFDIAITADAASTAAASDYNPLPAALTLPANANGITFTLQTLNDNLTEGPVTLLLAGNANGYTVNKSGVLNIVESSPLTVTLVKGKDGAEPATDGAFTLQLPGNTVALNDITVTLTMVNTDGTDNFILPATQFIIPQGQHSVNIPVVIKDDYVIQGDGEVTATLQSASITTAGVTYPVNVDNSPAIVTIHDDESDATGPKAEARKVVIEKVSDAHKPATNGAFRVHFADERLSAVKDVQLDYSVSGDAIPDADYQALPGTVTIPAMQTEVVVPVVPILNQNVYKDVTATFTLEQVTSSMKSIDWKLSDTGTVANMLIRDDNGVPDTAMQIIGPNQWTDDTTRKIRVHPALSPNGDGVGNDAMYIENINKFPENEVTVFNRWGATVFHTRNYTNTGNNFAGRYNTNGSGDVPEGTYYYIIYINDKGKQERYTGFVVIRR